MHSQLGSSISLFGCFQQTSEYTYWCASGHFLDRASDFRVSTLMNGRREAESMYVLDSIYDTTKYHQLCGSLFGYATPHVDFGWVLMLIL